MDMARKQGKGDIGDEHLWWLLAMKQYPPGHVGDEPSTPEDVNYEIHPKTIYFYGVFFMHLTWIINGFSRVDPWKKPCFFALFSDEFHNSCWKKPIVSECQCRPNFTLITWCQVKNWISVPCQNNPFMGPTCFCHGGKYNFRHHI